MNISIKGGYRKKGSEYLFRSGRCVNYDDLSLVRVAHGKVTISTDVLAFTKIYYCIDGDDIIISNKLKDFYHRPIDERLMPLQIATGAVPYPFTILNGVRKAVPGLDIILNKNKSTSGWSIIYDPKRISEVFRPDSSRDPGYFRKEFLRIINTLRASCDKDLVISLSGGFDSTLLCDLFRPRIKWAVSYIDSPEEKKDLVRRMKDVMPDVPWHIYSPEDDDDREGVDLYFDSIDEPCCDVAGLAEYLMLRKLIKSGVDPDSMYILNGEGADSLFLRERAYFKEYMLGKLFFGRRAGLDLNRLIRFDSVHGKAVDYLKSTKTRFYDDYTEHLDIGQDYQKEIDEIYDLYYRSISMERANFSGALDLLLFCSNQATNKLLTAADSLGIKYLIPFYDRDMLRFAFSIDAGHKAGYFSGKKILKSAFPEIREDLYRTGSPRQINLWHKTAGTGTVSGYRKYYFDRWLSVKNAGARNSNVSQ